MQQEPLNYGQLILPTPQAGLAGHQVLGILRSQPPKADREAWLISSSHRHSAFLPCKPFLHSVSSCLSSCHLAVWAWEGSLLLRFLRWEQYTLYWV